MELNNTTKLKQIQKVSWPIIKLLKIIKSIDFM